MSESTMAVSVHDLSYRFGRRAVLSALDFEIPTGAFYALLGANGAGKTTLLQLLAGTRPIQQGEVKLFNTPLKMLRGEPLPELKKPEAEKTEAKPDPSVPAPQPATPPAKQ